jgi:gliding motility-associated-like protein
MKPELQIVTQKNIICEGDTAEFNALLLTNGQEVASYQWQVNEVNAGINSPTFSGNNFRDGDTVQCVVKVASSCESGFSNTIPLTVNISPIILTGSDITITRGETSMLNPIVSGDMQNYLWTPVSGLSDSHIRNPYAHPVTTTSYKLTVTSTSGCDAIGFFKINVFGPLNIPNAFTPNGDGRNDVFYVLGGEEGTQVKTFSVFNRLGQQIFHVHDVPSNDPAFGWNGYFNGAQEPAGSYVYLIEIGLAGGMTRSFRGSFLLIR